MQTDVSAPARVGSSPIWLGVRALGWGVLSLVGFIASFMSLVWPIGQLMNVFGLPHPAALGLFAISWVLAGGLLALVAARFAFGAWCTVRPTAWLVLLVGAALSAAQTVVLTDWTIARFGYNESDFVGPTSFLWAVVAGVAVSGFGVQVAPRWTVWSPLVLAAGGTALGATVVLLNLPGLADGLAAESVLLATVTAAVAVYVGAVAILSFARLRRG